MRYIAPSAHPRRGPAGLQPSPPHTHTKKEKLKKKSLYTQWYQVLRDLRFSRNQAPKSADEQYMGILKNRIKNYEYIDFFHLV